MRAARLMALLALASALLLPAAMPALADGDEEWEDDRHDDGRPRDGDRRGGGEDGDDGDGDRRGDDDDDEGGSRGDGRGGDGRDRRHKDGDHDEDGDDKERDEDDEKWEREGKKKDKGKDKDGDKGEDAGRNDPGRGADAGDPDAPGNGPTPPVEGRQVPEPGELGEMNARPRLEVSQDYDVAPGRMTFLFTVENHGSKPVEDVQLVGEVPEGPSWAVADLGQCELQDEEVACDVGDLAPGATRTVAVQGILAGKMPEFTNVVQVYAPLDARADASPGAGQ